MTRGRFRLWPWPALALAAAVLIVGAHRAAAENPISTKRAEAAQVLAALRVLDERLEQSVEAYNLARIRLAANARALATNAREVAVARRSLRQAQRLLAARLVYLYTTDEEADPSLVVVLESRSLLEVIDRLDAARRVAEEDARIAREVRDAAGRLAAERGDLRREHERRARLVAELASRRASIEGRLAERRRLLASVRSEIATLEAKERARQDELRRQAAARVEAPRAATPRQEDVGPALGVSAETPDGIPVAPDTRHAHVVPIAMRYLGVPYRWAGASPETGFDCSGFVLYVYAQVGISLPHNAALQYQYGAPVAREDLQPGDLVFFDDLGHDGIYIGGGQFIQAPRTGDVVKISSLSEAWYAAGYVGARRLP